MIKKKFGFYVIAGGVICSAFMGAWWCPFLFMTLCMYDAIKPEDKQ